MKKHYQIICFVDADYVRNQVTWRFVTGIILLQNNTSIPSVFKCQKTVEAATYASEMVVSRIAMELIISPSYYLYMLQANSEPSSCLNEDNLAVVLKTTISSFAL